MSNSKQKKQVNSDSLASLINLEMFNQFKKGLRFSSLSEAKQSAKEVVLGQYKS